MRVHFLYRHALDTVVVLEEGNLTHPRFPRCDMLVPRRKLNGRHPATAQCAKGAERRRPRLVEADLRESTKREFYEYEEPLENVRAFKYLGRVLTAGDDDFPAVKVKLSKSRKS